MEEKKHTNLKYISSQIAEAEAQYKLNFFKAVIKCISF